MSPSVLRSFQPTSVLLEIGRSCSFNRRAACEEFPPARAIGASNIRRRVLDKAVEHANETLAREGQGQLSANLGPHDLRRTFASLPYALGEAPPYVMAQMGNATANLTLAIYARQMDRRDGEPERLRALVAGREPVAPGSEAAQTVANGNSAMSSEPVESGVQGP